jgi:hypothetical protein
VSAILRLGVRLSPLVNRSICHRLIEKERAFQHGRDRIRIIKRQGACFTDSIAPLLRFFSPSALTGRVASRLGDAGSQTCPASTLARVTRRFPKIASRTGLVLAVFRFANSTGAVRRVATREMLSERVDSPHHEGAVPSRAAVETPGRHGHVSESLMIAHEVG